MGRRINQIQTSVGEGLLNPDETVEVYIDRRNKISKKVGDLIPGDKVIFKRKGITKTSDELLSLLEANPVYEHARSRIYYVYTPERQVTLLRKLILEGLISQGAFQDTDQLRRAIVLEDCDLSSDEFRNARESLEELLKQQGKKPAEVTLNKWLGNDPRPVVLPYSEYREALAAVINSEIETFSDKEGERYKAWSFWRSCREHVTKRLRREKKRKSKTKNGNGRQGSVAMVVADIVDQVIEDYDEETCLATIVSNTSVKANGKSLDEKLILNSGNKGDENLVSLTQIQDDIQIIYSYAMPMIGEYLKKRGIDSEDYVSIQTSLIDKFSSSLGCPFQPEIQDFVQRNEGTVDGKVVDSVMADLMENIPDKYLGITEGTTRKLLVLIAKLMSQVPRDILRLHTINDRLIKTDSFTEREILGKEVGDLKRRAFKRYGYVPNDDRRTTLWNLIDSNEWDIFGIEDPRELKERSRHLVDRLKARIYTKKEISETLGRYGFEHLTGFNYWNFVLDEDTAKMAVAYRMRGRFIKGLMPPELWLKQATVEHTQIVNSLLIEPERIEPGLIPIRTEYGLTGEWARADILYRDSNGGLLVVEAKQHAINRDNGDSFNNALKAVEQTTGYRAAVEAQLSYCPMTSGLNIPVRGMLVAYEISDLAKRTLESSGCEWKEIEKSEGFNKIADKKSD